MTLLLLSGMFSASIAAFEANNVLFIGFKNGYFLNLSPRLLSVSQPYNFGLFVRIQDVPMAATAEAGNAS